MASSPMLRALLLAVAIAAATAPIAPVASAQSPTTEAQAGSATLVRVSAVTTVDGARIHYDVVGDLTSGQTPLLVLHGAYMSADAMAPFVQGFARSRPVIVLDQRGHGRTGDAPGPITFERLADDAAAVLDAAGVTRADVFGYSMGGSAAVQLAVRHPERVSKLAFAAAGSRFDTMYPEVVAGIAQITPEVFDNTPIRQEYDRLAPRPQDFPILVEKLKALDATPYDWDEALRALRHPTMIVMGDYDIVTPENAVEMFRLRGGGAAQAAQGFLTESPPARLLILPATSHVGVMAEADTVVALVTRFLDDAVPVMPPGFR